MRGSKGEAVRIGLIGFGYVGTYVYEQITAHPEWGLEVAFVYARDPSRLNAVPPSKVIERLENFERAAPDLIAEMAHPAVTVEHGERFLRAADYMPLSTTALADAQLEERLRRAAEQSGRCLYIPHGAAVGLDSLDECRDLWEEVTVVMKKNPRNLDFTAAPHLDPREQKGARAIPQGILTDAEMEPGRTIVYDGATRGICSLFPRNVNSHAAVALAGIGFDRTRSVLIADPSLDASIIQLSAHGNGISLRVERSNPIKGVTGVLTLRSILSCISRAKAPGLHFQII